MGVNLGTKLLFYVFFSKGKDVAMLVFNVQLCWTFREVYVMFMNFVVGIMQKRGCDHSYMHA